MSKMSIKWQGNGSGRTQNELKKAVRVPPFLFSGRGGHKIFLKKTSFGSIKNFKKILNATASLPKKFEKEFFVHTKIYSN